MRHPLTDRPARLAIESIGRRAKKAAKAVSKRGWLRKDRRGRACSLKRTSVSEGVTGGCSWKKEPRERNTSKEEAEWNTGMKKKDGAAHETRAIWLPSLRALLRVSWMIKCRINVWKRREMFFLLSYTIVNIKNSVLSTIPFYSWICAYGSGRLNIESLVLWVCVYLKQCS